MKSLFNTALVLALISAGSAMAYHEIDQVHEMQDTLITATRASQEEAATLKTLNPFKKGSLQDQILQREMASGDLSPENRKLVAPRLFSSNAVRNRAAKACATTKASLVTAKNGVVSRYAGVRSYVADAYTFVRNNPAQAAKKVAVGTMAALGAYVVAKYVVKPYVLDPVYNNIVKPAYTRIKQLFVSKKETKPAVAKNKTPQKPVSRTIKTSKRK